MSCTYTINCALQPALRTHWPRMAHRHISRRQLSVCALAKTIIGELVHARVTDLVRVIKDEMFMLLYDLKGDQGTVVLERNLVRTSQCHLQMSRHVGWPCACMGAATNTGYAPITCKCSSIWSWWMIGGCVHGSWWWWWWRMKNEWWW